MIIVIQFIICAKSRIIRIVFREIRKIESKGRQNRERHCPFVLILLLSIFRILLPETSCHAKTCLHDRTLCQRLVDLYLFIIKQTHDKYILSSPILEKMWQKTGAPTLSLHDSHAYNISGAKKPTLGKRVPGHLRVCHTIFALFNFTYLLKSTDDG